MLPLIESGEFAKDLDRCHAAAEDFHARLTASALFTPLMSPELDIVVYAVNASTTASASARARQVFGKAASKGLHLALIELPVALTEPWLSDIEANSNSITCLRSVLMKPEHHEWSERIVGLLEECTA